MSDVKTIGKYQIRKVLGRGGMGVVYQAYDPDMDRLVAIKTLHANLLDEEGAENLVSRFRGEARAYGRLMHHNIVTCYSYEESDNFRYIVMEFVSGRSLKEIFDTRKTFSIGEAVAIMRQLLSALSYSHENGVVHRDIKPANLLIMENNQVKVTDFGIARIDTSHLTQTGNIIGSPSYMSPEQFTGVNVDHRTDIFSAGVVFYQLLTGERPFEGSDLITAYHAVTSSHPEKPSVVKAGVPHEFDAVIARALAKDPDERFSNAGEFLAAIDQSMQSTTSEDTILTAGSTSLHGVRDTVTGVAPAPAAMAGGAEARVTPKKGLPFGMAGGLITVLVLIVAAWLMLFGGGEEIDAVINSGADSSTVDTGALTELEDQTRVATIERMLDQYECASLWTANDAGGKREILGYVSREQDVVHLKQTLAAEPDLAAVNVSIQIYIWPFCELLQMFSPYVQSMNNAPTGVSVLPVGDSFNFREGENLRLEIITPSYDSYVYVDYFPQDGGVVHLYPNSVLPTNAQPSHSRFVIGDVSQGGQKWTISPPFGQEMIVVIASKQPLFPGRQPLDVEQAAEYLQYLKAGMQGVPASELAADYIFITTEKAR